MLVVVLGLAKMWNALGVAESIPHSQSSSLPAIFLVGIIAAASSCLAVVGGLLLSVSAAWSQQTQGQPTWVRLQPMLLFNAGRLAGYFLFGGIVGFIGQAINPGGQWTGYVTVVLSLVMILIGVRILHLVPSSFCRIPMPRGINTKLQKLSKSNHPLAAVLLGALTFFVPCGFTQSVQLLALGSGSFLNGALMMFVFALGTLPMLLGISVVSSLTRGKGEKLFLLFSGTVVLVLGFGNLQSGLLLTGVDAKGFVEKALFSSMNGTRVEGADPYVTIDAQGRQVIAMYVTSSGYKPDRFTIEKNRPTWIYAVAEAEPSGCANFMQVPSYGVSNVIHKGGNWVGPFTPSEGTFVVTCSMGMLRADVTAQ